MSMKRRQREAVLLALANALRKHGSWCGETHLQKATYFMQELCDVPLKLEFILYKHGPFSFELRDELTAMRADGLMEMRIQPPPYGPSLVTAESGQQLMTRWPNTLRRHSDGIDFVAKELGSLGGADLERVATALYVTKANPEADADVRAQRIHDLKPHVSPEQARAAVETVDTLMQKRPKVTA